MSIKNILKLSIFLFAVIIIASGCGSDSTVTPPVTNGTVNGKVVDVIGNPISGVTVVIGSTNSVTGTDGSFSIANVTTPYNVKLILAIGSKGIQYDGITTLTPQLYGLGLTPSPSTAILTVNIPPLGANQRATVIYTDGALVNAATTVSVMPPSPTLNITWQTTAPVTGKVIVLLYTVDGTGKVTSYDKYGEKTNFVINNGGNVNTTFNALDLNVTPGSATVSGTATVPAGFLPAQTGLLLKFSSQGSPLLGVHIGANALGGSFSFLVPTNLTSTFTIGLQSSATTAAGDLSLKLIPGTVGSSNTISLETPSTLGTPVNAAVNVDTTTNFTYSTGTGTGVYVLQVSGASQTFYRFTNSTSITIPSFSAFGLSLAPGAPFTWQIIKIGSMATVNDMVSLPIYNNTTFNTQTVTATRTFTSAP